MVDPDILPSEDRHAVAIRYGPVPGVLWGVTYDSISSLFAVVDVDPMYDDVGYLVDGYAWPTCDMDACAPPIYCFERVHN